MRGTTGARWHLRIDWWAMASERRLRCRSYSGITAKRLTVGKIASDPPSIDRTAFDALDGLMHHRAQVSAALETARQEQERESAEVVELKRAFGLEKRLACRCIPGAYLAPNTPPTYRPSQQVSAPSVLKVCTKYGHCAMMPL